MFDTLVLCQFFSDFVEVKSYVSPRLSSSTREFMDQTIPLTISVFHKCHERNTKRNQTAAKVKLANFYEKTFQDLIF